ncbi:MAG: glycerol-3-phosphate acyltransferase [Thermoflexus sp.]|nr:glycerol-3-phosphate acyltransferase [Thermoflexus sp.]
MVEALWSAVAFLSGSLPLAWWIGRWGMKVDIRQYGDGNPGAMNVRRAGGRGWFVLALLLEFFKGAIPIWLARHIGGLSDWALIPLAIAAPVGHAFSPWLGFRGGKALAVTFGVWSGLTLWQIPMLLGGLFALFLRLAPPEARAVRLGTLSLDGLLAFAAAAGWAPVAWLVVALGHTALLLWTHRRG